MYQFDNLKIGYLNIVLLYPLKVVKYQKPGINHSSACYPLEINNFVTGRLKQELKHKSFLHLMITRFCHCQIISLSN